MPWVEVFTREELPSEARTKLAEMLSTTILKIEIGYPTESAKGVDWMWFHTLPKNAWAVGGEFSERYVRGRTMCFARIIAPEALMNFELKTRAIAEVTENIREALATDPQDDGTGIWVILTEIPRGHWGAGGRTLPLPEILNILGGEVSDERRSEMNAHFDGIEKVKSTFGIPQ